MELKPGYKQTEVGVIPEDWDVATVSDTCDLVVDCKNRTPPFVSHSEFAVVRTSNVRNGRFVDVDLRFTDYESFRRWTSRTTPKTGDIMLTREAPLGEVCAVPETPSVCLGQRMMLLRPSGHLAQSSYLLFTLMSEVVKGNLLKKIGGSTVGHAKVDDIRLLPVPLPPLEEQKHISAILLDVDNLVRDLESLIAKKQGVKQAAMQELLTGKRRLPGFEGEWEVKRLGDVAHIKTGSRNNEDKSEDGEYPFFVRSDNVERIGSYSYDCEAVLVPGEGRIGEIFHYINGRFDVHQRVYAITRFTQEVSGKFVHFYMAMKFGAWAMQNTVKATVDSLRIPTFQNFEMLVPPTKEEQDAIARFLTEIDAEIAALEARKDKAQMVKQGTMQQLLTGKIRLI